MPYNDDYMIFDELSGHYVLTSKFALDRYGIDLYGEINERNSANAQIAVNAFLRQVSNVIYNFIHSCTVLKTTGFRDCAQREFAQRYYGSYGRAARVYEYGRRPLALRR